MPRASGEPPGQSAQPVCKAGSDLPSAKLFPLNESTVHYAEFAAINTEPNELSLQPLFVTSKVREDVLAILKRHAWARNFYQ